jgi:hypothetical protein
MSQKNSRFSKAVLASYVERQAAALVRAWSIDEQNGTSQCAKKSTEFAIAYGEYRALKCIWDEYELAYVKERS